MVSGPEYLSFLFMVIVHQMDINIYDEHTATDSQNNMNLLQLHVLKWRIFSYR